jgi:hypothetical protein
MAGLSGSERAAAGVFGWGQQTTTLKIAFRNHQLVLE